MGLEEELDKINAEIEDMTKRHNDDLADKENEQQRERVEINNKKLQIQEELIRQNKSFK